MRTQTSPTREPMTLSEMRASVRWLGKTREIHSIGPYNFVEYHPQATDDGGRAIPGVFEELTSFSGFVDGRPMSESFSSLDAALAGAIAYRNEGHNHRADIYFLRAICHFDKKEKQ